MPLMAGGLLMRPAFRGPETAALDYQEFGRAHRSWVSDGVWC
jgi:hypothetical protein